MWQLGTLRIVVHMSTIWGQRDEGVHNYVLLSDNF